MVARPAVPRITGRCRFGRNVVMTWETASTPAHNIVPGVRDKKIARTVDDQTGRVVEFRRELLDRRHQTIPGYRCRLRWR